MLELNSGVISLGVDISETVIKPYLSPLDIVPVKVTLAPWSIKRLRSGLPSGKTQGISYLSSDETKVNPEYDSFLKPVRVIS